MATITKFRIEATGKDKDEVIERMSEAVADISKALRQNGDRGHWECTDDVIYAEKELDSLHPNRVPAKPTGNYKGRMVMTFREYEGE
jgi:hypothetical protein